MTREARSLDRLRYVLPFLLLKWSVHKIVSRLISLHTASSLKQTSTEATLSPFSPPIPVVLCLRVSSVPKRWISVVCLHGDHYFQFHWKVSSLQFVYWLKMRRSVEPVDWWGDKEIFKHTYEIMCSLSDCTLFVPLFLGLLSVFFLLSPNESNCQCLGSALTESFLCVSIKGLKVPIIELDVHLWVPFPAIISIASNSAASHSQCAVDMACDTSKFNTYQGTFFPLFTKLSVMPKCKSALLAKAVVSCSSSSTYATWTWGIKTKVS